MPANRNSLVESGDAHIVTAWFRRSTSSTARTAASRTSAIPAEFVAEYTADRVETTAEVWLGQTFNCTRCHDHKFDPFTQRDFYSMKAFFSNVGEQGEGALDTVTLSSPELENKIAPLQKEVVALQEKLSKQKVTDTDIRVWAGSPCSTRRRA